MSKAAETRIPLSDISVSRQPNASIAVVGGPNSGKSTLFNRLTGLRQRIGNYPGVTVERHVGTLKTDGKTIELVDLPGTHGLSAHSFEEQIAINVIFGRMEGTQPPDAILAVVDATNLYQGLFLVQQLLELERPVVVALTMFDVADTSGLNIDVAALSAHLSGIPVCPVVATTGKGINELRNVLVDLADQPAPAPAESWPELSAAAEQLARFATVPLRRAEIERLLIDGAAGANQHVLECLGANAAAEIERHREKLFGFDPPLAKEARVRYGWVRKVLDEVQQTVPPFYSWRTRLTEWINRPVPGTIGLFLVMAIVFQAVFAWATPIMDLIDDGTAVLGSVVAAGLGDGALASLVSDGIIAGVGSVIIFLPQILILFLFIILLEDSGYLARAAYLMDRAMRLVGLSGQSIIPMISSFACAVPGIMATRVIPNRRDRIATIIAAPFMTCSARLPVYALLIAAFVPAQAIGFLNLQGLVLFALYMFGIIAGILTALLLRKTALRGPKPPFALMLPEFRRPNIQTVMIQLLGRAKVFLYRAGTVIFSVAVVVWALAYYPRATDIDPTLTENQASAAQLEQSWLGRAGKFVEPAFEPLGWDWRVSSAVIAGFPAREVVIAVLGTVYAVGDEADEATLSQRLKSATWPDGRLVFTFPMVIGLLIFYACCLQCAATLAVIRRETNTWRWPAFAWLYMTSIGYVGALLAYQLL
ncbi:MAG: ferrous iron transport protein B [Gammaproteobacteria bacterium]|nr:ferrous iron transport protein B [Gammaproteobacteria bacterium]MDH3372976.1 ferrous iron transport protein B [Gammaproteobacteria bacterium]MDH3408950.1 ferrous iron transport protein B [Gammaproteobacteria bacterium]MDH3552251.1 ferrous iron transport protein B [Gammaproteobacteria bacterium]